MAESAPDPRQALAAEALDKLEARIREQASIAPQFSMEWRAHFADLAHLAAVRGEVEEDTTDDPECPHGKRASDGAWCAWMEHHKEPTNG
jgi:hypothetical protein